MAEVFEERGIVQYVLSDGNIPSFVLHAVEKFNLKFYDIEDAHSKFMQVFQEMRGTKDDQMLTAVMCAMMRYIRMQLPDTHKNRTKLIRTVINVVPTKSSTRFTHGCQIESFLDKMDKLYSKKQTIKTCTCLGITLLVFAGTSLIMYNMIMYM